MKKIIFSAIVVMKITSSLQAMDTNIEFQGEKKPLLGWIMVSQLNTKHPFSITSVVRYDTNEFILKGDILNLNEQDLNDISNNNYVYCPFYSLEKTRLSMGRYEEVGAIILGTTDQQAGQQLHFAKMRNLINNK
ncbi:MAG TPA: hypothetical protein VKR54_04555 [Candidatus Babeliales bacterium]|nr:hypothetical protein [Candidatus Babeliales bacterium]